MTQFIDLAPDMSRTATQLPTPTYSERREWVAAAIVWAVAAPGVVAVGRAGALYGASVAVTIGLKMAVVLAAGILFGHLARRTCSVEAGLMCGALWLSLGVVTEIAITSRTGHPWFGLLGAPSLGYWPRTAMIAGWMIAPALCLRRGQPSQRRANRPFNAKRPPSSGRSS